MTKTQEFIVKFMLQYPGVEMNDGILICSTHTMLCSDCVFLGKVCDYYKLNKTPSKEDIEYIIKNHPELFI